MLFKNKMESRELLFSVYFVFNLYYYSITIECVVGEIFYLFVLCFHINNRGCYCCNWYQKYNSHTM